MSIFKSTAIIGVFTMLSRVFGFVRDVIIANAVGASWLSDAFFVAFKLPNFFRRLFAEGAFNAAFVPLFAGTLEQRGRQDALRFAGDIFILLLIALLALNAIVIMAMPYVLYLFAPGFADDPEKFGLTTVLAQIAFPYIFFISLTSLLSGILNSIGRFAMVASTPILLNLALIGAALFLTPYTDTPAHALSIGVFIAGLLQLCWVGYACIKYDVLPPWCAPRITPHVKQFFTLIAPAALGAGVAQVNLLIDVILASTLPEGVSYLYYADRLNELPIGVIGVAAGTALLPALSKQFSQNNLVAARRTMNQAVEFSLVLTLPAALALMLLPGVWITGLFEHGAFTVKDSAAVSPALAAYASGLPAFILAKIFTPGFFAQRDTKTPFYIASICVLINLILNLLLIGPLAHVGLAYATAAASWINVVICMVILYRRGVFEPSLAFMQRLVRIFAAATLFAVWLIVLGQNLAFFYEATLFIQIATMASVVMVSLLVYGIIAYKLAAVDKNELKLLLPRRA